MAEVTLAQALRRKVNGFGGIRDGAYWEILANEALSWLASVLADDATVEVVVRALWTNAGHEKPWEEVHHSVQDAWDDDARAALAALSAHLAAPGPAGDTSGEVGDEGVALLDAAGDVVRCTCGDAALDHGLPYDPECPAHFAPPAGGAK